MTIAQGISKKVALKKETVWGVAATAAGARYIRRVSSDLSLSKDSYESKEIRTDQQTAVHRHGMRKVEGTLKGELSPGSYSDLIAAQLRKNFAAGPSLTGNDISATAGGFETVAGDFVVAGFRPGIVLRAAGFANAQINARNFVITKVTAKALAGEYLTETPALVEAAGGMVTLAAAGLTSYVPESGHTDDSFTIEHFFGDIGESEVFTGIKVDSIDIKLPPTGMAEISAKLMGKDLVTGQVEHFTNPAPASTMDTVSAVNGRIYVTGSRLTLLTSLDLSIKAGLSTEPVVGSNTAPELFRGRVVGTGNSTAFFENGQLRDAFLHETEVPVFAVFPVSDAPDADFLAFRLPRVKFSGASKDDGEKGVIQNLPFVILKATGDTTISIQDSAAV